VFNTHRQRHEGKRTMINPTQPKNFTEINVVKASFTRDIYSFFEII